MLCRSRYKSISVYMSVSCYGLLFFLNTKILNTFLSDVCLSKSAPGAEKMTFVVCQFFINVWYMSPCQHPLRTLVQFWKSCHLGGHTGLEKVWRLYRKKQKQKIALDTGYTSSLCPSLFGHPGKSVQFFPINFRFLKWDKGAVSKTHILFNWTNFLDLHEKSCVNQSCAMLNTIFYFL